MPGDTACASGGMASDGAVGALTLSVSAKLGLVPSTFVAVRVTLEPPAVVGVPLITPVLVLSDRPAGRFVAVKADGALVAVIAKVNGRPTVAATRFALEIAGTAPTTLTVSVMVPTVSLVLLKSPEPAVVPIA